MRVEDAKIAVGGYKPYTLRCAIAGQLQHLSPGSSIDIGPAVALSGEQIAYRILQSTILGMIPPGWRIVTRKVGENTIRVIREA